MGLVLGQIASEGLQHEYWCWVQHRPRGARVDAWGESDLPRCTVCYQTDAASGLVNGNPLFPRECDQDRVATLSKEPTADVSQVLRTLPARDERGFKTMTDYGQFVNSSGAKPHHSHPSETA